MKTLVFLLMIISGNSYTQEPIVYSLTWYEQYESRKVIRFVSLSDQYILNKHEDSLAVPASSFGSATQSADDYIRLTGTYRRRCLDAMGFTDNDIVFIYDYANDKLLRFYVRGLNLIAVISLYSFGSMPATQFDYMIGFEIDPAYLMHKNARYLVSIGKTSPFTQGKVKPIAWTKVDTTLFPSHAKMRDKNKEWSNGKTDDTYRFKLNGLIYFVQNISNYGDTHARHVVVINAESKQILFERMYGESEGSNPSALKYVGHTEGSSFYQFTGELFKNKPPVIFGFMDQSFGCPGIEFIAEDMERVYINCDNRH